MTIPGYYYWYTLTSFRVYSHFSKAEVAVTVGAEAGNGEAGNDWNVPEGAVGAAGPGGRVGGEW